MSENRYIISMRNEALLMARLLSAIKELDADMIERALKSEYINEDQRIQIRNCRKEWGF